LFFRLLGASVLLDSGGILLHGLFLNVRGGRVWLNRIRDHMAGRRLDDRPT